MTRRVVNRKNRHPLDRIVHFKLKKIAALSLERGLDFLEVFFVIGELYLPTNCFIAEAADFILSFSRCITTHIQISSRVILADY